MQSLFTGWNLARCWSTSFNAFIVHHLLRILYVFLHPQGQFNTRSPAPPPPLYTYTTSSRRIVVAGRTGKQGLGCRRKQSRSSPNPKRTQPCLSRKFPPFKRKTFCLNELCSNSVTSNLRLEAPAMDGRAKGSFSVGYCNVNSMKGRPVHGRIFQGNEPPQFIALFQPMIVLKGGLSSDYKSHLETKGLKDETYAADGVALFLVSGTSSHNNRVIQVDTAIKKLMDGDAISALDPRLEKDSSNELEHERILELALQCLQSNSDSWPSMNSCAEILRSIRKQYREQSSKYHSRNLSKDEAGFS